MIACPALFMALILTTNFRKTLRLYSAKSTTFGLVTLLAASLHPLACLGPGRLSWFFPQLPENIVRFMEQMHDPSQPLWIPILTLALAPAVCEEIRPPRLYSQRVQPLRTCLAGAVLSALTFGAMHMIPMQVFNATLLGLVLGFIAIKTNSILPGIWFHFLYNSMTLDTENSVSWPKMGGSPTPRFMTPRMASATAPSRQRGFHHSSLHSLLLLETPASRSRGCIAA